MDRQQVFIGQIPQDIDILLTNKNAYIGLAKACAAILGISTLINQFTCSPTGPASMQVVVGPGEIYSLQNIDNTAYGSLSSDTTHTIVKQGINLNSSTLTLTAPSVVGDSWNVLIQVGFSETDGGSTVLPYYNASNPSQAFSGPANNGQPNNTIRQNQVTIQAKTGVAALTGTQTTPSPDTGFVGAFVVTIAQGQTTITSGNISTYGGAPFITETLTQKISQATADLRYAQISGIQNGQYVYGVDTSVSANTVTATLSPAIGSYGAGMVVNVKIANTNTGASTANLNGLGAINIKHMDGTALVSGDMPAGAIVTFKSDGTNLQLTSVNQNNFVTNASHQNDTPSFASSTSAANTYTATLSPAPAAYTLGMRVSIKFTNANTGAATLNLNSLGAINMKHIDGSALNSGDIPAGGIGDLRFDGTNFQLLDINPGNYVTATQHQNDAPSFGTSSSAANTYTTTLTPAPAALTSGMRLSVKFTNTNTGAATLNPNSLGATTMTHTDGTALKAGDIPSNGMADLRFDGTNLQLLNPNITVKSIKTQIFTSSGTYTPSTGLINAIVELAAGGGGGGGVAASVGSQSTSAGGGGAGGYAKSLLSAATIGASQTITIGSAGTAGASGGGNGGAGGSTSFGALLSATGGSGGTFTGNSTGTVAGAGLGGVGSGGNILNLNGGAGGSSMTTNIIGNSGFGGSNLLSAITPSQTNNGGTLAGANGSNYGGGGSGAIAGNGGGANVGGTGAAGIVIITEYCNQ